MVEGILNSGLVSFPLSWSKNNKWKIGCYIGYARECI